MASAGERLTVDNTPIGRTGIRREMIAADFFLFARPGRAPGRARRPGDPGVVATRLVHEDEPLPAADVRAYRGCMSR